MHLSAVHILCVSVAFSAALANDTTVSTGDIIKFDYEFIDTHGLHNPTLGTFTVPQTGIYEVSLNLYKNAGRLYDDVIADIYVNDTRLTRLRNRYADATDQASSSSSVIREFTIGSTLYIRAGTSGTYYGSSFHYSQFNIKYLGTYPLGA